ncbi:MAG: epoxide hydrolase family protein [Gammaproteobacteria bacterium]
MSDIRPFSLSIADEELTALKQRLHNTRWPEAELVDDWSQGVPLSYLQDLCNYWASEYDWRRCEAEINQYPQFITEIDGIDIHFVHIKSPHQDAAPLVMTHGWPGSIVEFLNVIKPLTDPTAYGGDAQDAFHLVLPTMPGYGFSAKPTEPGWTIERIGQAWTKLMVRLGYQQFFAQGGDWGSTVTHSIAATETAHCRGAHVNMSLVSPSEAVLNNLSELEKKALAANQHYANWDSGYSKQQTTRPQTIGYGLVDSPAGLAAWIVEKFWSWTDNQGHPEDAVTRDQILDDIMFYWLTGTGASSARLYWESFTAAFGPKAPIEIPFAYSCFPKDIFLASKRWYEERCSDLRYFNALDKGGHFAALEQPALFVDEVRAAFRTMRD